MSMQGKFRIGYIPTIDHLILGVAVHNGLEQHVVPKQFESWQTISNALAQGKIDGAFLLFPLAFELFRQGADIRLVLLGHREGQLLIARTGIQNIADLKGKTVFVPDIYSTHHILLHLLLKQVGMTLNDITLKTGFENPREMVTMLEEGTVDAFVAAEPMVTDAEQKGIGTILKLSHDINPHHVDCVLVMRQDAINVNEGLVQNLIDDLVKAGLFINAYPRQAAEIGEPFLGWPRKLLLRSLTHDRSHILFWDLLPRSEEFAELQDIAVQEMHLWDVGIDIETLIEPRFAQQAYREWVIDTRREVKDRGGERTLPGNFQEAVDRFRPLFTGTIDIAGLKFITPGGKYLKQAKHVKDMHVSRRDFLEEVFEGTSFVVKTQYAKKKALAFFPPEKGVEPDRVLLKLSQDQALKVLQALEWGERIAEVKKYDEVTADRDLFSSNGSVSAVQDDTHVYFSLNLMVFRFVVLLLYHL